MLMWEDGFCRGRVAECLDEIDGEDPVRKSFSKMSIQLYNYGEGLMGKVASDKCHKWVFKEPSECEANISNYWQSSFDALPPEWTDQFESGIQTIAVIQAGHGLLQLGSCKIIPEDLHFVLRMRHTFESLGYQSGFYLSQLFSSTRGNSSSSSTPNQQLLRQPHTMPIRPPVFNWVDPRPTFQNNKDEPHMFLHPHSSEPPENMMAHHEAPGDIKWPNGLTFFSALTGRSEDAKLLFNNHHDGLGNKPDSDPNSDGGSGRNEFLSLDNSNSKMENKFKRSFTLPARMASSSSNSSTSLDHQGQNNNNAAGEYRNSESGMYSDVMETFLE